ncbi:MAG: SPFH domain-containing protein [Desulfobacterales bacterium]|jgi:regulator of protease activity HflC (stomatin/prohibitin superfamily)
MKHRIILFFLTTALLFTQACVFHTTGETEVGVRTKKLAFIGKKGVEDKVYAPGSTYFFLPYINDWHTFDTKLQNLEMTFEKGRGDRKSRDDLLFKTIDGNDISLDVIIAYQIDPSKAPYILQYVATDNKSLREKIVRTVARSKPRDVFGELKTEEFYVANKREFQAQRAKDILQEILGPMGVMVISVLTKDYRFNEEYQKAIEDRKIADQQAEKNKSAQRAATEEYKRKLEQAKGEVNKMIAKVDGEYLQAKIESDAYYQKQQLLAKAITAEGVAQAKGIREMNKALTGIGGEALVKLKIADALQGKRILLLPVSEGGMNLRTMDMNQLIQTLGVRSLSGKKLQQ